MINKVLIINNQVVRAMAINAYDSLKVKKKLLLVKIMFGRYNHIWDDLSKP